MLTFIELEVFSKVRDAYLDDDELAALQAHLIAEPDTGDVTLRALKDAFHG